MNHRVTGRAWVFGDGIDTDAMYPGFAMKLPVPEAAEYVFYDLRPGWTEEVEAGDIVVAGRNFGVGSSRPVAALMRHLGVAALVAEEFNSLFLRNAINNGPPALTVPGVRDLVRESDEVTLHMSEGWLDRDGTRLHGAALPPLVLDILDAGGLLPRLVNDGYLPAPPDRRPSPEGEAGTS
ncbi:3-isopropylmalate dehydratase small subunit [Actinomadura vinacea]|uniref:3-isopropylmalate dehydratase small subunit n=1 Tax=Actinomadura vinacea TaxID=115336 RepID=A0ABN3JTE5_9ACTN